MVLPRGLGERVESPEVWGSRLLTEASLHVRSQGSRASFFFLLSVNWIAWDADACRGRADNATCWCSGRSVQGRTTDRELGLFSDEPSHKIRVKPQQP